MCLPLNYTNSFSLSCLFMFILLCSVFSFCQMKFRESLMTFQVQISVITTFLNVILFPTCLSFISILLSCKTYSLASASKSARNDWPWSYCWALQELGYSEAAKGINQWLIHLLKQQKCMLKKKKWYLNNFLLF